ncbi:hypothetical protein ACJX0J_019951, partial [Zea mays]
TILSSSLTGLVKADITVSLFSVLLAFIFLSANTASLWALWTLSLHMFGV